MRRLPLTACAIIAFLTSCAPAPMSQDELAANPIGPYPGNYREIVMEYFSKAPHPARPAKISEPKPGRIWRGNRGYGFAWEYGYLVFADDNHRQWQFIIRDGQIRYAVPPGRRHTSAVFLAYWP